MVTTENSDESIDMVKEWYKELENLMKNDYVQSSKIPYLLQKFYLSATNKYRLPLVTDESHQLDIIKEWYKENK